MVTKSFHEEFKFFLADDVKHNRRVHQLDFIGTFLQAIVKNRIFVYLGSRYIDYLPEYSSHFERALRLLKCMYGMTNYGRLFSVELIE